MMKVRQDKLPDSQVGLEIEIPPEASKQTYEKVLKDLTRNTIVPGFRKGKAPRPIVIQRLGKERIKAAALDELIKDSLQKAIKQESIDSLGNYTLESDFDQLVDQYQPGETLTFAVKLDVPPTVTPCEYNGLTIKAEEQLYAQEKVDNYLKGKQEQMAPLIPVEDRPAQMGDQVVIDYEGRFVGETEIIPGVEGKEFQVELVEGQLVTGMVEGILGMTLDQTKEITVTFPDNYARADLAGKEVTFTITLKELKEKELPALDDEFAAQISEYKTIQELRESLEKRFQDQAQNQTKNNIQSAIVDELVKQSTFDLPKSLIQEEVTRLLTQSAVQLQEMGLDIGSLFTQENLPEIRKKTEPEAIERLKQDLILAEIAKRESIKVSEAEITAKVEEIKTKYPEEKYDLAKLMNFVTEDLIKEKTLELLQSKVKVELVPEGTLKTEEDTAEEDTPPENQENTVE